MPRTLTKVRVFNPGGLRRNLKRDKKRLGMKVSEFGSSIRKSAQTKYKILAHHNRTNKRVSAARAYNAGSRRTMRKGLHKFETTGSYDYSKVNYKLAASAKRKAARASNPPKRKLSLAQKLHFGTKRQRAAAGLMLSMAGKRKRVANGRSRIAGPKAFLTKGISGWNRKDRKASKAQGPGSAKAMYYRKRSMAKDSARVGNPGEIITLAGLAGNPGRLRTRKVGIIMAKRRTRKFSGVRRRVRRTRRANPNVMVRYSRRRRNTGRVRSMRRRTHRRSNPGFLSGGVGMLVGIFGGAALTGAIAARIPGQLSSGIAGYLTTGVVAYAQGTLAGKLLKNPTLGKNMVTGGLIYLGLKIAGDLIPGLSLPFGLSGLGAIGSSNFSYPQIPANNTMLYASPTPVMAAAKGMGRIARMGRGY